MRSIKRGRAQSLFTGIVMLVMSAAVFVMAMDAGGDMGVDGSFAEHQAMATVIGLIMLGSGIYSIYSATCRQRFSEYEITDDGEEPDPMNSYFEGKNLASSDEGGSVGAKVPGGGARGIEYCPYCGASVEVDYEFCASCGRRLPVDISKL